MESTNQVAHQIEGLTLNTGTTQASSSSSQMTVTKVVDHASNSTSTITQSASVNTPHVTATTNSSGTTLTTTIAGAGATTTTTSLNIRDMPLRRQDAYRINVHKAANILRAEAIALGQVPPAVSNHRANNLNWPRNAQRVQAIRRGRRHSYQVNRQVNRPTINMLRQLEAKQRAPIVQIPTTPEERAAAERAEREQDFWYVVAQVGMTHLVGQRELDEWMAKYQ